MISLSAAAAAIASVAALSAQFTQQHLGHKIVPRIVRQSFSRNRGGNLWQLCATASDSGSVSACSSATAMLSPKQRDTQALPLSPPLTPSPFPSSSSYCNINLHCSTKWRMD